MPHDGVRCASCDDAEEVSSGALTYFFLEFQMCVSCSVVRVDKYSTGPGGLRSARRARKSPDDVKVVLYTPRWRRVGSARVDPSAYALGRALYCLGENALHFIRLLFIQRSWLLISNYVGACVQGPPLSKIMECVPPFGGHRLHPDDVLGRRYQTDMRPS